MIRSAAEFKFETLLLLCRLLEYNRRNNIKDQRRRDEDRQKSMATTQTRRSRGERSIDFMKLALYIHLSLSLSLSLSLYHQIDEEWWDSTISIVSELCSEQETRWCEDDRVPLHTTSINYAELLLVTWTFMYLFYSNMSTFKHETRLMIFSFRFFKWCLMIFGDTWPVRGFPIWKSVPCKFRAVVLRSFS